MELEIQERNYEYFHQDLSENYQMVHMLLKYSGITTNCLEVYQTNIYLSIIINKYLRRMREESSFFSNISIIVEVFERM
jgi:hypothetical protein